MLKHIAILFSIHIFFITVTCEKHHVLNMHLFVINAAIHTTSINT
jgi:hypothetical protein